MTNRNPPPPPGRPRPPGGQPRLEAYRPAEERTGPSRRPGPPPPGQGYPPHTQGPPQGGPRGTSPRPAPREKSGFTTGIFYAVLGLVAMIGGAVAFTVTALPAGFVRDRVIAAVKEKTGRDLVIAGPASFTIFPSVGVSLGDVSLSSAPGVAAGKPLVSMQTLDVSVALLPLLKREIRVGKLVLRDPVFNLEIDAGGRKSWDFAAVDEPRNRVRLAQAEPAASSGTTLSDGAAPVAEPHRKGIRLGDLKLDDVRIDNGTLNYLDARSGSAEQLSAINLELVLAALAEPLLAKGTVGWKGKTVSLDGTLTSVADIVGERPAKLKLALGSDAMEATFEGSASLHDSLLAEGILSAKSSSVRNFALWLGTELPPSEGFTTLTASGLLRGTPGQFTYSSAEIVLDRTTARGQISLDTKGARPHVTANLKLTELDLNTYSSKHGAARKKGASPEEPAAKQSPQPGAAQSIEDILERSGEAAPGPRVKGFTQRDGWSEDPFELADLGLLDADAKLSIGHLTVSTIRLDQSDLTVALKNRVMTTTLDEVRLYQGKAHGTVTLDGSAEPAANVGANITLDNISAQHLLADAAGFDRIAGNGRLAFALAGKGASEREIVETLNGKIEFAVADGAVIGVNIPEMARNIGKGNLGGLATKPTDKTDFTELTSTWTVKSGVAENQDLKLIGPLLRVSGSGRVELPAREVDYMLRPKLVASLAGQGGAKDLSGIEIPVRMHGPWANPKFTPDFNSAFKDPDKAMETVKEIGKQFKGKKADEIVNDLLGGQGSDGESTKSKGKKLLDKFLNPQ